MSLAVVFPLGQKDKGSLHKNKIIVFTIESKNGT